MARASSSLITGKLHEVLVQAGAPAGTAPTKQRSGPAMRNESAWKPTKFVRHGKAWRASRDRMEVAAASLLIADISVRFYQEALEGFAGGRLIDLGCGKAPLYGIYRSRVDSVVCVDWPYGDHGSDFV